MPEPCGAAIDEIAAPIFVRLDPDSESGVGSGMAARARISAGVLACSAAMACSGVDVDEHARLAAELDSLRSRASQLEAELAVAKQDAEQARARARGVEIDLPRARAGESLDDSTNFVFVGPTGWTIGGETIDAAALDKRLRARVREDPDTELVVAAGPDAPFASVAALLDVAAKAGVDRVSLAPPPPPEPEPIAEPQPTR